MCKVEELVQGSLREWVKILACFPQRASSRRYNTFMDLQHSEKVTNVIALLVVVVAVVVGVVVVVIVIVVLGVLVLFNCKKRKEQCSIKLEEKSVGIAVFCWMSILNLWFLSSASASALAILAFPCQGSCVPACDGGAPYGGASFSSTGCGGLCR